MITSTELSMDEREEMRLVTDFRRNQLNGVIGRYKKANPPLAKQAQRQMDVLDTATRKLGI